PRPRRALLPERRRPPGRPLVLPLREPAPRLRLARARRRGLARVAGVPRAARATPPGVLVRARVRRVHARRDPDAVVRARRRASRLHRARRARARRRPRDGAARAPRARARRSRGAARAAGRGPVRGEGPRSPVGARAALAGGPGRRAPRRQARRVRRAVAGRVHVLRARDLSLAEAEPGRPRARARRWLRGRGLRRDDPVRPRDPPRAPPCRRARARGGDPSAPVQRPRRRRPARLSQQGPPTLQGVGGAAAAGKDARGRRDPGPARRARAGAPAGPASRGANRRRPELRARARLAPAMKHAGPAAPDELEDLLAGVRAQADLKEKSRGCFYHRSRGFLHFHEDPEGLFADLKTGADFERFRVSTRAERSAFLKKVAAALRG